MTNIITVAARGPQGIQGLQGPQGVQGAQGIQGIPGQGVPAGGSTGQALLKASSTDYSTVWGDVTTGFINSGASTYAGSLASAVTAAYNSGTNPSPLYINNASTTSSTSMGGITTLPGSRLSTATAGGQPGVNLNIANMSMNGFYINETGAGSTAIQMNTTNTNNILIVGSRILSGSYSYLHNDAVADGSICSNTYIISAFDGPNYNHPTNPGANIVNVGNVVDTGGFGFAIARCNAYNIVANIIRSATNTSTTVAALHVEDWNTGGVIVANHAINCKGEGFSVQVPPSSKGVPDPITVGFNQLAFTGASKTNYVGFNAINDGNGGVTQLIGVGNVLKGWDIAMTVSDSQHALYNSNIITGGNMVHFLVKHARGFGLNSSSNTPAFMQGQSGCIGGSFASTTVMTSWLSKQGTNFPGPAIAPDPQISVPVAIASGTGSQTVVVGPMPSGSHFDGKLRMVIEGGGQAVFVEGYYNWNGTTMAGPLYMTNSDGTVFTKVGMDIPNGSLTGGSFFSVSGGNLIYNFTTGNAITQTARFEAQGTLQQNT